MLHRNIWEKWYLWQIWDEESPGLVICLFEHNHSSKESRKNTLFPTHHTIILNHYSITLFTRNFLQLAIVKYHVNYLTCYFMKQKGPINTKSALFDHLLRAGTRCEPHPSFPPSYTADYIYEMCVCLRILYKYICIYKSIIATRNCSTLDESSHELCFIHFCYLIFFRKIRSWLFSSHVLQLLR